MFSVLLSTHNICFVSEIRKLILITLLSGDLVIKSLSAEFLKGNIRLITSKLLN